MRSHRFEIATLRLRFPAEEALSSRRGLYNALLVESAEIDGEESLALFVGLDLAVQILADRPTD